MFSWRLPAKKITILGPRKYPFLAAINCQVNTFSWQLKAAKLVTFLGGHQSPSKVLYPCTDCTCSWHFGNFNGALLFLAPKPPCKWFLAAGHQVDGFFLALYSWQTLLGGRPLRIISFPRGLLAPQFLLKKDYFVDSFGIFRGGIWPPRQLRFGVGAGSKHKPVAPSVMNREHKSNNHY